MTYDGSMGRWLRIAIIPFAIITLATCASQDDFAAVAPVELVITPLDIIFPAVTIDDEALVPIILQNTGLGTAHVSLSVSEAPGEDENAEFVWEDPAQVEGFVEVPGGQTVFVNLAYRPLDIHQDSGTLLVTYDDGGRVSIPLTTFKIEPDLDVAPPRVVFERVRSGTSQEQELLLKNEGPALLQIQRVRFDEQQGEFALCSLGANGEQVCAQEMTDLKIPFTEELPLTIRYQPTNDGEDVIRLLIESNDPDSPVFEVEVTANLAVPCLSVNPALGVDFGLSLIGNQGARTVTLINCSRNKNLAIESVAITASSDPAFGLILLPEGSPPLQLQPGDATSVAVSYAPDAERVHEGALRVSSNDPAWPELELPLRGEGTLDGVCPNTAEVCDEIDNDCDGLIDEEPKDEVCDGADNDCDEMIDEYCPRPFEEQFQVTDEQSSTPVDFVMAIDTSGSMGDTVQLVAANLFAFVERLVAEGVNVRLTLLADQTVCIPEPLAGPGCSDTDNFRHLHQGIESTDALVWFQQCVDGPCNGEGGYRGDLRPGSLLQYIVVTDDESHIPWSQFKGQMDALGISDFVFHGIVGMVSGGCVAQVGNQYITGAQETGGEALHICDRDWGAIIDAIFEATISRLQLSFPLTYTPIPETVQLLLAAPGEPAEAAVPVPGTWSYSPLRNSVVFLIEHPPEVGSTLVVRYTYVAEEQGGE